MAELCPAGARQHAVRELRSRPAQRGTVTIAVLLGLLVLLTAAAPIPAASPADTRPQDPPGNRLRCPSCDDEGQMECPRCEGHGKLEKTCPRCEGTGERDCPQCSKHEREGTIPCGYCGGKGSVGTRGERSCPECAGSGEKTCPTCRGQGHLDCRETVYGGVCTLCRFARRIRCVVCDGEKWITREQLRRASEKREAARDGQVAPERPLNEDETRAAAPDPDAAEEASVLPEALETRLRSVGEQRIPTSELDVTEIRSRADGHVRDSKELLRRLGASGSARSDLREGLELAQGRSRLLRTRLQECYLKIENLERAYLRCERRWVARPPAALASTRYREFARDMDISLRAAEARAAELADASPLDLVELAGALDEEMATLASGVDAELLELDAARAAAAAEEEAREKAESAAASPAGAAGPPPNAPSEEPADNPGSSNESAPSALASEESTSRRGTWVLLSILGVLGVAGAIAGWRRRAGEAEFRRDALMR